MPKGLRVQVPPRARLKRARFLRKVNTLLTAFRGAFGQVWLRIQNIWSRGLGLAPLSQVPELSKRMALCSTPRKTVLKWARTKSDFTCSGCGASVQTTDVEVTEIFTDVVQSIRRGRCSQCGSDAEFENRFYRGNMSAKHDGEWYVILVRPSIIERIAHSIRRMFD